MYSAFLAFSQNLKDALNLSLGVKYSHVLLNPIMMFVAVSVYSEYSTDYSPALKVLTEQI